MCLKVFGLHANIYKWEGQIERCESSIHHSELEAQDPLVLDPVFEPDLGHTDVMSGKSQNLGLFLQKTAAHRLQKEHPTAAYVFVLLTSPVLSSRPFGP